MHYFETFLMVLCRMFVAAIWLIFLVLYVTIGTLTMLLATVASKTAKIISAACRGRLNGF